MSSKWRKDHNIVLTAKQVRSVDKFTIESIGIPELVLMENAGLQISNFIKERIADHRKKAFLALAGSGNNGGDAMVIARHLKNQGIDVQVLLAVPPARLSRSAKVQLHILRKLKVRILPYKKELFRKLLTRTDICLDGLLGTGFQGSLREPYGSMINRLNESKTAVLSIDIPSGLNADTGEPSPLAVKADWTITLGAYKKGLFTQPSKEYIGKLHIVDIGLALIQWRRKKH